MGDTGVATAGESRSPSHGGSAAQHVEVIDPTSRATLLGALRELWHHRDLVLILTRRDVSVRYKQAVFGFAWAVAQPLVMVLVFTLFLHYTGQANNGGLPYPVFALSGLVAWTFFSNAVTSGGESLVGSSNMISKVYFPRLALPTGSLLSYLPDFGIALVTLGVLMGAYRVAPGISLLALPVFIAFVMVAALGVTTWTSALNVAYRDVRYAVPFAVQLWLFATPAIYTFRVFHGALAVIVALNPMTGAVQGLRWALVGVNPTSWLSVGGSALTALLILVTGLNYFHRTERYFADVI